eukprot:3323901-Pleurochrysis_carterae.AAC.5
MLLRPRSNLTKPRRRPRDLETSWSTSRRARAQRLDARVPTNVARHARVVLSRVWCCACGSGCVLRRSCALKAASAHRRGACFCRLSPRSDALERRLRLSHRSSHRHANGCKGSLRLDLCASAVGLHACWSDPLA